MFKDDLLWDTVMDVCIACDENAMEIGRGAAFGIKDYCLAVLCIMVLWSENVAKVTEEQAHLATENFGRAQATVEGVDSLELVALW